MIENLFTSKTRIKLLKLFLSNPDKRYYLRGLERELKESLTPLRRELLRLTHLGILIIQEEANIKYYCLNKDFERLEELQRLILGQGVAAPFRVQEADISQAISHCGYRSVDAQFIGKDKYSRLSLLFATTVLLIGLVAFLIWTNSKNIQNLAKAISTKSSTSLFEAGSRTAGEGSLASGSRGMRSLRWKILLGNWPILGGPEERENEKSKEL